MLILCDNGTLQPFWRAQGWALEQMISIDCVVGDLRWAMVALVLRSLRSVWVLGRDQFVLLVGHAARRPVQDADSMVAAGGGYGRSSFQEIGEPT